MKRFLKPALLLLVIVIITGFFEYGSPLFSLLFGTARVEWLSEQFSEVLREKNELVVYEAEIEAQETFTQDAWLIGTVQKVEIPYRFSIRYVIDLSCVKLSGEGQTIMIEMPLPEARYPELVVNEELVRVKDWLYPLTPEKYSTIKVELEKRLVDRFSAHDDYLDSAWNNAVYQIEQLFENLTAKDIFASGLQLKIERLR